MKPDKKMANTPWMPTCWVGGGRVQDLMNMNRDGDKYLSAVKATAAILRAMRK